ncbi:hypothetical protein [Helicobacter ibis]|uniref:Methyl-accepting chemotaxis protein n=1 Tax=Helicobacter ibis TaxID=2962633 RepID=A0ABT4VG64_9HELI|nr:hypothetical protein [Helicobacter ibis]MDA3969597.1 hypothetical protein [Helicobacter ibis]
MNEKLQLGTKLIMVVSSVVVLVMIALTIIISTKLTVALQDEAHKLLQTESVRLANRVQGAVGQTFAVLESAGSVMALIVVNDREGNIDQKILLESVERLLRTNQYARFAYFYVPGDNVYLRRVAYLQNTDYLLDSGEFMIFAHRENNDVAVVKAEDNLKQFNSLHNAISNKVLSMGRVG